MENASKALIIAGAILLSILIISLGIMVYNNAKSTVGEANLDSEQAQTYNSKFIMYTGEEITADKVNSLIAAINSNNATNANTISLTVPSDTTYYTGSKSTDGKMYNYTFNKTTKYKVTYTLGTTGLVNAMEIALPDTTTP